MTYRKGQVGALPAALVLLIACGDSNGGTGPGAAPVASVELTAPVNAFEQGATVQLTATARDAEGYGKIVLTEGGA